MSITNEEIKKNINNKNNDNDTIINLLIEIPFIKILPTYVIQEICHSISMQKYKKNEYAIKQGEPISNIYIVKSGSFLFSINHQSISNISHNINSFIRYQNITNEPFLEERKYELEGKITNNQQIFLYIYQKKNIFGDIELISGKSNSFFSIRANEDESALCFIDRNKWVHLTKRIRIPFTKITIDKMNRIQRRIEDILTRKNKMIVNKVKMYNDKINYQIEVNDNYDNCIKKIEKKEEKLENELKNIKSKNTYMKLNKLNKSKSVEHFQQNKKSVLNLFKYPNIIKNETRKYLNSYLNYKEKNDLRKFKLNNTKSSLSLNQDSNNDIIQAPNNLSLIYNHNNNIKKSDFLKYKSKLFLTNSIKPLNKVKNRSLNDIFDSTGKSRIKLNNSLDFQNSGEHTRKNNINNEEFKKFKNFSNLVIKSILARNHSTINQSNENKINKKVKIQPIINNKNTNNYIQNYQNKDFNNSLFIPKKEKMDLEKINKLLQKKYDLSKSKIIEQLFGKKDTNNFNE